MIQWNNSKLSRAGAHCLKIIRKQHKSYTSQTHKHFPWKSQNTTQMLKCLHFSRFMSSFLTHITRNSTNWLIEDFNRNKNFFAENQEKNSNRFLIFTLSDIHAVERKKRKKFHVRHSQFERKFWVCGSQKAKTKNLVRKFSFKVKQRIWIHNMKRRWRDHVKFYFEPVSKLKTDLD